MPLAGITITPELVAIVSTLAVATGFAIKSDDDLVDLCYSFYSFLGFDKIKEHNQLLETVALIGLDGLLTIPSSIVSDFKTYGDNVLSKLTSTNVSYSFGLPCVSNNSVAYLVGANFPSSLDEGDTYYINQYFKVSCESSTYSLSFTNDNGLSWNKLLTFNPSGQFSTIKKLDGFEGFKFVVYSDTDWSGKVTLYSKIVYNYDFTWSDSRVEKMYSQFTDYNFLSAITGAGVIDLGLTPGSFDWEKIKDKINEEGDLPLYLPKDLLDLLNNPGGTFDPTKDNVYTPGDILTFPNILNPSLEIDGTTDIPIDAVTDVPGDIAPDIPGDTTDDIFPSYGDSLDFSPLYATGITDKFPFSLPWDFGRLLDCFNLEPTAPVFKVPIVSETITIDLSEFDEWANIVRFFVFIGFLFVLIYSSKFFRT